MIATHSPTPRRLVATGIGVLSILLAATASAITPPADAMTRQAAAPELLPARVAVPEAGAVDGRGGVEATLLPGELSPAIAESSRSLTAADRIPPPPDELMIDMAAALADTIPEPTFTPFENAPSLNNRSEFAQAIDAAYPSELRDAGLGGTALVWVYIEEGLVQETSLQESSGYERLDEVAMALMKEVARFEPALLRGERVPVWVALPITFVPN